MRKREAVMWYYQQAGQQFGPIPFEQLQMFVVTGQLLPTDLVWTEGMIGWMEAGAIDGLFSSPAQQPAMEQPVAPQYPQQPVQEEPRSQQWYYMEGENRCGPVKTRHLKRLVADGKLQPADLVWTEGLDEWMQAKRVMGLFNQKPDQPGKPGAPRPIPISKQGSLPAS